MEGRPGGGQEDVTVTVQVKGGGGCNQSGGCGGREMGCVPVKF